jgi:hypothetical protein
MPKGLQGHYRIAKLDGSRSSDEFGLELKEITHCLFGTRSSGKESMEVS